jgi:hypothetical protein
VVTAGTGDGIKRAKEKEKAERQIISRGCARGSYDRIARAYNRTGSDVQVGIKGIRRSSASSASQWR